MKSISQGLGSSSDWTEYIPFYYDSDFNVKLGPYAQSDILHYTKKDLITDNLINVLETKVWNKYKHDM